MNGMIRKTMKKTVIVKVLNLSVLLAVAFFWSGALEIREVYGTEAASSEKTASSAG